MSGEDDLLRWLRLRDPELTALLGDDAALLPAGGQLAVTVDSQIAGVHFPPGLDEAVLARRVLAVNLSDLAAMAARPRYALLALAAPPGFDHRRFFRAFLAHCRRYGVRLAGGDLAGGDRASAVVTLIGERPPRSRWLLRSGARPGDRLWLGGWVGESALGCHLVARGAALHGRGVHLPADLALPPRLCAAARRAVRRHLQPEPQLELGSWLGRQLGRGPDRRRHAGGLDVSDGLALDLHRLCRESGTGAEVDAACLPYPPQLPDLCRHLGLDLPSLLLGGGEDYVLLFSLPARLQVPERFGCHAIGWITAAPSGTPRCTLRVDDQIRPLPAVGWDHLLAQKPATSR